VSDLGDIRRTTGTNGTRIGFVLTPRKDKDGYQYVALRLGGKTIEAKVHHLVLRAFHGIRRNRQANHLNTNKSDNNSLNLEWATQRKNMLHSYKNGRKHWATIYKEKGISHPLWERVGKPIMKEP